MLRDREAPSGVDGLDAIRANRVIDYSVSNARGLWAFAVVFLSSFGIGLWVMRQNGLLRRGQPDRAKRSDAPTEHLDVARISIAFDWNARKMLQTALDALATTVTDEDPATLHGAATTARELLIANLDEDARFAIFSRFYLPAEEAEARFRSVATDLRARFSVDSVRNEQRQVTDGLRARPDEGEGMVVVTLLVASFAPLGKTPRSVDRHALREVLLSIVPASPKDLGAFEVIWSPAEELDRMSSAELETLYPELLALDEAAAELGRRVCSYCRAPFTAELSRCPSCGADD